ncbi:NADH:flavin oxidoreductase [Candidatus Bipolaricaulota bacterium]
MSILFSSARIGALELPNRLVRSATAEHLANADGWPKPKLKELYQTLVRGGVGLIITGHMYVHPSGRSHTEMLGIHEDGLIGPLAELAEAVHGEGGQVVAQINHVGMKASLEAVAEPIAPTTMNMLFTKRSARAIAPGEADLLIEAFGEAARRAREAGFDGVQIHAAHGYLISQYLSPLTNQRTDEWGGSLKRRVRFLTEVCKEVRSQVGKGYPVLVKLGMMDRLEGGLAPEESVRVAGALEEMGLDGLEISGGIGSDSSFHIREDIRSVSEEAYFRPLAQRVRSATNLPILLVGGLRSKSVMEDVVATGDADFISLCRPLICEPELPNAFRQGLWNRSSCISCNRCLPEKPGDEGIACKLNSEASRASSTATVLTL